MSTKVKSTKTRNDDLRMVFYKTWEDFMKAVILRRDGKIPKITRSIVIPLKMVSLLKKKGVEFRKVVAPIAISDLTSQQKEDLKNKKAKLIKIESLNLIFFSECQS